MFVQLDLAGIATDDRAHHFGPHFFDPRLIKFRPQLRGLDKHLYPFLERSVVVTLHGINILNFKSVVASVHPHAF